MRVIYHKWSVTKQHPHPQSVAEISRHSVLSGDRIRQCETSSGSRHTDDVLQNATAYVVPLMLRLHVVESDSDDYNF